MERKITCYGRKRQTHIPQSFNSNKRNTNNYIFPISTPKKFRWHDEQGRQLTAGGLLPYDDEGIWAIGEKKTKDGEIEWTDPGGKYKFEDCDIYTTISREFSEEMYHSSSISRDCILQIKNTHTPTYVNGHQNRPVYICYLVHTEELKKYQVKLDYDLFLKYRQKTLSENPNVPPEYYSSIELRHISFGEIENINLSYRLKRILKYGTLFNKLVSNTSLSRSLSPNTEENTSEENTSEEGISEENTSEEGISEENISEEGISEENISEENTSEEGTPGEGTPGEGTSEECEEDVKYNETTSIFIKPINSPIPIKVSNSPVVNNFEKVFSLNVLDKSLPL